MLNRNALHACSWSLVLPSNSEPWHWGYYTGNFLDPAADSERWGAALLQVSPRLLQTQFQFDLAASTIKLPCIWWDVHSIK